MFLSNHPRGLRTLFFTEMWERFSYYGMRALLVLFMGAAIDKGGLAFDPDTKNAIYGLYGSLVYLTALPGGWIADRLLGARRSVWYGGLIIAAGHFTLAIPSTKTFFIGLLLIILGTSLLKPNISVIVGELYSEKDARRDAGFTIFYMGINLGSFFGPLVCGWLHDNYDWHDGFAAAGVGMALGLIQYRLSAGNLGEAGLQPKGYDPRRAKMGWLTVGTGLAAIGALAILGLTEQVRFNAVLLAKIATYIIFGIGAVYFICIFLFSRLKPIEKKRLVVLIVLLLASWLFWAGFEQAGSSFNVFADKYTVRTISFIHHEVKGRIVPYEVPAEWFQSLNPIFILIFAPLFASLWVRLGRRGLDPSTPAKFALGLIGIGAGLLIMVTACMLIRSGGQVGPWWLVATYLIHTFAELCLSPVGLSAVTKLAPKRFAGQMMGMWFLSISLGSLSAGLFAGKVEAGGVVGMPTVYMRIVVITIGLGVVLLVLAHPLKKLLGGAQ